LHAIHRLMPLRVIAPELWFPVLRPAARPTIEINSTSAKPPVLRPRMFYFPGVLKRLDARFYARSFERGLRWAAREQPPTLVDAHFEWPDGVGAWRVARQLGIPFICTLRGKLVSQIAHPAKRRQIREMLLGADALIAVSRALADLACDVAGRDLKVRVIPNGVDGAIFKREDGQDREETLSRTCSLTGGWSKDAKYVVSVGHLQALKGFDRLLEIWPEVRKRIGDVRLVLVGGGAGEPRYERMLREQIESAELGETGRHRGAVTLTGRLAPEQVAAVLNVADLFIMASRSEGCCNAIVEALACGCPVVATDVGGNAETVNDPGLGRLAPSGNRDALADAVCRALEQPWNRRQIAAVGGRRDWQQTARECVDVFESVIRQRTRGPRAG
jgi:glycosyltransferase involved in cell wall biosynthesis